MTTSGVTTLDPVRDTVVYSALRKVGAYAAPARPRADQVLDAVTALNLMIKSAQVKQLMHVTQFVTLFLEGGTAIYDLPGAYGASAYDQTTLTAAVASAGTVLPVTTSSGITAADIVGIILSDGTLHWDVVASVDSTTQITITTGLSGAASSAAYVYSYNSDDALYRPTRIFHSNRRLAGGNEVPLTPLARDEYQDLTNKSSSGTPVQIYYDPQRSIGKLYVWPVPTDSTEQLVFSVDRPLEVMLDSEDTFDFPGEWIEVLVYALAVRIAPEYGIPLNERLLLEKTLAGLATDLFGYNMDYTSTFLGVQTHG